MIKRIVKMTFRQDECATFLSVYRENWQKIKGFPGCHGVELLNDSNDPSIFFTYSTWENAAALENYRNSGLFTGVWSRVKPLFREKAQAWSTAAVNMDQGV